jgi:hypothetical protein
MIKLKIRLQNIVIFIAGMCLLGSICFSCSDTGSDVKKRLSEFSGHGSAGVHLLYDGFYYCQPKSEFKAPIIIVQAWYDIEKPLRKIRATRESNLRIEQEIREKFPELFN